MRQLAFTSSWYTRPAASGARCHPCCSVIERRYDPSLYGNCALSGSSWAARPIRRFRVIQGPILQQLSQPAQRIGTVSWRSCASDAVRIIQDRIVTVGDADVKLLVEDLGGRRRRISGGIDIEAATNRVWHVLTQYALMDQFMPNITKSDVEVRNGQLYLDQIGVISRRLGLKSRMLMRVAENSPETITFSRVEGRDFSEFEGRYIFRAAGDSMTRLDYELCAIPMPLFPVALVERKIVKEVPGMLAAIRLESIHGKVVALQAVM